MKFLNITLFAICFLSLPLAAEAAGGLDNWSDGRCRDYLNERAEAQFDAHQDAEDDVLFNLRGEERMEDQRELLESAKAQNAELQNPCAAVRSRFAQQVEIDLGKEAAEDAAHEAERAREEAFYKRQEMDKAKALVSPPISY